MQTDASEDFSSARILGDDPFVSSQDPITNRDADAAADAGSPAGDASALETARAAIRAGDEVAALRTLRRAQLDTVEAHFTQNLARNLAALAKYRPDLRERLGDPLDLGPYRLVVGPTGHPIPALQEGDQVKPLTPGADPIARLHKLAGQIATDPQKCLGVAIAGIGDGYLLPYLAQQPDGLNGMQQAVYILETDLHLLRAALHVLDHSAAAGPIALGRFRWFIGEDAAAQLAEAFVADTALPTPNAFLEHPPRNGKLAGAVREAVEARKKATRSIVERIATRCADPQRYDARRLGELFRGEGDRPPRALLLTSRFTTVLQYATQDVADALHALGWETRTVKETQPWHRMTEAHLARQTHDADPDLVFQLDHLRHELSDWFPRDVPFVCWIQDNLSNLTDASAGEQISERDFVLTSVPQMYTELYRYPPRQCISMSKLTSVPERPASRPAAVATADAAGDDLAFVSNASKTPQKHREELLAECSEAPRFRDALALASDELIEIYRRGNSVADLHGVGEILDRATRQAGIAFNSPAHRQGVVTRLFEGLNNALYRQQALHWARQIAEEKGLSLALYGKGWDEHPEFHPFARGPIAYGPELEDMTRRTRINLQIVPYFALHQRLLDGLVAGGFFLVRHHPTDVLLPGLANFLDHHLPDEARTLAEARAAASGETAKELESWVTRCAGMADLGVEIDVVQWVRSCQEAELLTGESEALPALSEVSFRGPAELSERVERFLGDPEAASRLANEQRRAVESRLTHEAGMRRMISSINERLQSEGRRAIDESQHAESQRVA